MSVQTIEWTAALFGMLGAVLLALKGQRAGWGFVAYLASNAGWINKTLGGAAQQEDDDD